MSAFDSLINIIAIDCKDFPEPHPHVEVYLTVGAAVPGPGNSQAVLPLGRYRFMLDKEAAEGFGKKLAESGASLPEDRTSDFVVASDMSAVEQAAERMRQATEGRL